MLPSSTPPRPRMTAADASFVESLIEPPGGVTTKVRVCASGRKDRRGRPLWLLQRPGRRQGGGGPRTEFIAPPRIAMARDFNDGRPARQQVVRPLGHLVHVCAPTRLAGNREPGRAILARPAAPRA